MIKSVHQENLQEKWISRGKTKAEKNDKQAYIKSREKMKKV